MYFISYLFIYLVIVFHAVVYGRLDTLLNTAIPLCVLLQDMSGLMHTIYDVVDASVNQGCHSKSKTLRVKLTVTPEPSPRRREHATHPATGTRVATEH